MSLKKFLKIHNFIRYNLKDKTQGVSMKYPTITKKNIRRMVDHFYSQVLKDELIGDFFIEKLGDEMISDEWLAHLDLLTDFWAFTILGDSDYKGSPIKPHIPMKDLKRESFERWLELFSQVIERLYEKEPAEVFIAHSQAIADDFMKKLKL